MKNILGWILLAAIAGAGLAYYKSKKNKRSICTADEDFLTAMSFNVLYIPDNRDGNRISRVCTAIENEMPDTFGVQEATDTWITALKTYFDDAYAMVGCPRGGMQSDDTEHTAIFYKKEKFSLIDSGTRWLTNTPHRVSMLEGSTLPRIFTYALLERRDDKRRFLCVNTHLDHLSEEIRAKQVGYLLAFLSEYTQYPIVLMGDFNDESGRDPINMIEMFGFANSAETATHAYRTHTFTNFRQISGVTIDFIFVTPDTVEVDDYRVIDEMVDGDYPSDHFPVVIRYRMRDAQE